MNRRTFLGALASLVAAPAVLLKLKAAPAPAFDWWRDDIRSVVDLPQSTTLHGLSSSTLPEWNAGSALSPGFAAEYRRAIGRMNESYSAPLPDYDWFDQP